MKKRTNTMLSLVALGSLMLAATPAHAATIISTSAIWPSTPLAGTGDVLTADATPSTRGLTTTRQLRQTFQVDTAFTLDQIYLSIANYGNVAFTIKFFQVADIEAATWAAGTQVGSTITVSALGSTTSGNSNLGIQLSGAEEILLAQRNAGTTGYGMELALVDTSGLGAFGWLHADNGSLAPGRFYRETGAVQAVNFDMGVALVPEPSSLALLGLGATALFLLRRRRRGESFPG